MGLPAWRPSADLFRFEHGGVVHLRIKPVYLNPHEDYYDHLDKRRVVSLCVLDLPAQDVLDLPPPRPETPTCSACEKELETRRRNHARSLARKRSAR